MCTKAADTCILLLERCPIIPRGTFKGASKTLLLKVQVGDSGISLPERKLGTQPSAPTLGHAAYI